MAYSTRFRRRRLAAQARLMILSGIFLGLVAHQALRSDWASSHSAGGQPPAIVTADPYAEARRSLALLKAQERAPSPALSEGRGKATAAAGSARVIDGDTFDYGGARIRVADIDTPEVNGRCPYETQLAARATRRMRTLLAAGPFDLQPLGSGRDEDRYGRKLRIVTRDGQSLGDVLVAEGLARTWTGRREPWCS